MALNPGELRLAKGWEKEKGPPLREGPWAGELPNCPTDQPLLLYMLATSDAVTEYTVWSEPEVLNCTTSKPEKTLWY